MEIDQQTLDRCFELVGEVGQIDLETKRAYDEINRLQRVMEEGVQFRQAAEEEIRHLSPIKVGDQVEYINFHWTIAEITVRFRDLWQCKYLLQDCKLPDGTEAPNHPQVWVSLKEITKKIE